MQAVSVSLTVSQCVSVPDRNKRPVGPAVTELAGWLAGWWLVVALTLSSLQPATSSEASLWSGGTETNGNQATGRRKKTTGWLVLVVGGNQSY